MIKTYTVIFYLIWHFGGLDFKCKNLYESFTLNKEISQSKLNEEAYKIIKKRYEEFFKYDNFEIHLISINNDS